MKSLIVWLFVQAVCLLACFAEPRLDATVRAVPGYEGFIIEVQGSADVTDLQLLTPIDRHAFKRAGPNTFFFLFPQGLPVYPSLFFRVNKDSIHYTPEIKSSDFVKELTPS